MAVLEESLYRTSTRSYPLAVFLISCQTHCVNRLAAATNSPSLSPFLFKKKKANSYITDDEDMLAHVQLQEQELNFPKDALSLVMAQVLW